MSLSRRQFAREFRLAAIQRLEMGASVAEVARAFEVNPNTLHRWRQGFRQGPGNAFPGLGKRRWEEGRVPQLERKIGQQELDRTLEAALTLQALRRALDRRRPVPQAGAPLRSGCAVRQPRIHPTAQGSRRPHLHVTESQSLGQRAV